MHHPNTQKTTTTTKKLTEEATDNKQRVECKVGNEKSIEFMGHVAEE
jgi:hypothetical protein